MKITDLKTFTVRVNERGNWVFVKVQTDEGIVGLGEASHSGDDLLVSEALKPFGEILEGRDPFRIEETWRSLARIAADRCSQTALSAVEQALWDIVGQALDAPVYNLLGGPCRDTVRLYANINRGTRDRSPDGFARRAEAAAADGFSVIKCAPFDEAHRRQMNSNELWDAAQIGLDRVRRAHEAVGSEVKLFVDCHCRFDVATAVRVAQSLEQFNVVWFEDPVPREPLNLLEEVKRNVSLPIAAGESLFGRAAFWALLNASSVDYIMPDVKHAGGVLECKKIAALAEMMSVPIAPHNPAGPVSTAASVHLCACAPNSFILEYQWNEVPWRRDLVNASETIVDGAISLPDLPGLGVRLNDEVLARHAV